MMGNLCKQGKEKWRFGGFLTEVVLLQLSWKDADLGPAPPHQHDPCEEADTWLSNGRKPVHVYTRIYEVYAKKNGTKNCTLYKACSPMVWYYKKMYFGLKDWT